MYYATTEPPSVECSSSLSILWTLGCLEVDSAAFEIPGNSGVTWVASNIVKCHM
jgi:hypothetical protein